MKRRLVTGRTVREGDVVLLDPLDESTVADVADIHRSIFDSKTELTLVSDAGFIFAEVANDAYVTVLR